MLKDTDTRLLATDPTRSFIVQAPAGSGKTELLSQRFLRLLACVQEPEHIVALTFTRKAASEMKERILLALRNAEQGVPAHSPHQQHTAQLAQAALANDKHHNWNLLKHPHRLRIMTIDALCQRISEAIPFFEKELPFAQITDSPQLIYQRAARACLRDAISESSLHAPIQTLLEHLDNRQDRLITLFCEMLSCREQWLSVVFIAKTLEQKDFEAALKQIEEHALERLVNSIPLACAEELRHLSQKIALIENDPKSPRYVLRNWNILTTVDFSARHNEIERAECTGLYMSTRDELQQRRKFKGQEYEINRDFATALAHLLLTQEDKLRKGFDHHVGLKKELCPDFAALKKQSQELCENLKQIPEFETLLAQVKRLPEPSYTAQQWQVLQALLTLLPLLVAELNLLFKQSNTLDFTQVTQQALHALGEEEAPTDLTLYLDHLIHHLLIDEFQDTSIQQVELIEKLVCQWDGSEGKTLFLVGDPMQSIYRFRQAEVGLFLKVREEGLGAVTLTSLELSSNFRSTDNIIAWINSQFKTIFPKQEDIESGAISFHPSTSVIAESKSSWISAHQFTNKQTEAQGLIKIIREQLAQFPEDKLAILVRTRSQLTEIIQQLRLEKISFQGVEINALSQLAHLRDMWTLSKTLLYPACRLSWLSFLRSPYCGLGLPDLTHLANFDKKKSIYSALQNSEHCEGLTAEGKLRALFVFQVLEQAIALRHQVPLVDWIINTAKQLHADYLIETHQQADLEQFWQLLERHLSLNQFPDLEILSQDFEKLYAKQSSLSRLQIMTIHKSKGLEFDSVIIPSLSSRSNPPNNPLIRWLKIPRQEQKNYLLVSPIKAANESESRLYNYLHDIDAEKESYELQRLFYVAVTRAKKRLYLLDNQERDNKGSFRQFLKHQEFIAGSETAENTTLQELVTTLPLLTKLPSEFYKIPPSFPLTIFNKVAPISAGNYARQLGILTHELLQWICTYHPQEDSNLPWPLIQQRAKQFGFSAEQIKDCCLLLAEQIQNMFADPIGNWIFQAHTHEKNEYALLVKEGEHVKTRIIDRTFIEHGRRWIIDFKTGDDEINHQEKHKKQVQHYAELLAPGSSMPISCGVYYLKSQQWLSWGYQTYLSVDLMA